MKQPISRLGFLGGIYLKLSGQRLTHTTMVTLAVLLGLMLTLSSNSLRASAATITVTNTNDSGVGSLRQAILDALPGDTVNFNLPSGSIIELTTGELLINKALTIQGPGAGQLTVVRSAMAGTPNFRIFEVNATGASVNVSGLTVTNGRDLNIGGGGIENLHGTLTITACTITGNTAGSFGGGVDCANGGETVNIVNCTITGNTVIAATGSGGGIDNAGKMTITDSVISNNTAPNGYGGGINNFGSGSDGMTLTNCTVSGNSAINGGGFENDGTLTIINSTISGNSANSSSLPIGGGIDNTGGSLTVISSTISGNSANGSAKLPGIGGAGGGLASHGLMASMKLINSTISGNTASGFIAVGGGLDTESSTQTTLTNCTITANSVTGSETDGGGGIRNGGTTNVANTIIAGNTANPGPDCSGVFGSQGFNLIGNSSGCMGFNQPGDQLDKNAQLASLANNGGPTQTHALMCNSPAIDAGNNALAKDQNGNPLASDQRGFPRIFNARVDIGSFESQFFSCPTNITVPNAPGQCGAIVNFAPASDPGCGTAVCSPPSGSLFPIGTTTVTCQSSAGPSCSFNITVVDTQLPTITCPANVTAVTPQNICPSSNCAIVNYPAPVATDNCATVVICNPPSGSCFPLGISAVNCTVTDQSGNTAACSFSVTVFDVCLQDDSNPGTVLLFNSTTGSYRFCCGGTTYTGTGQVLKSGCQLTLQHNPRDRRVLGKIDKSVFRGTASLQSPSGTTLCTIMDRDSRNNSCACQ